MGTGKRWDFTERKLRELLLFYTSFDYLEQAIWYDASLIPKTAIRFKIESKFPIILWNIILSWLDGSIQLLSLIVTPILIDLKIADSAKRQHMKSGLMPMLANIKWLNW